MLQRGSRLEGKVFECIRVWVCAGVTVGSDSGFSQAEWSLVSYGALSNRRVRVPYS